MLTSQDDVAAYQNAVADIKSIVENLGQFVALLPQSDEAGHVAADSNSVANLNAIRKLLIVVEEWSAEAETDLMRVGQR